MSGVRPRRLPLGACKMAASSALLLVFLINPTQGARIFRSPEPHLPAENLPAPPPPSAASERRSSDAAPSLHPDAAISLPRSAAGGDAEDFFAPGSWRPVRDPEVISASGRRRISPLASTGFHSDSHFASGRNLRHEDGADKVPSARTSETSSSDNAPTSTLGHSIALVANQLLQSKADILESRVPEVTVTGALKNDGHWPSTSLDIRTPPKLMLQISGQKNAAPGEEDADKKVVPIQDDPMGENFFPSRRQPTTVTTPSAPTTSGQFVTQVMVSTVKKNQTKDSSTQQPPAPTPVTNKVDRRPVTMTSTAYTIANRKSSPTLATITRTTPMPTTIGSTVFSSITPPQPPSSTSVKWKIAIPPNRQVTRFPPRKPPNTTTTTASPVTSSVESTKKENKPSSTGLFNPKPSIGGFTKPYAMVGSSRRPTSTITRVTTTPQPSVTTTSRATVAIPTHSSFMPTSRPPTTTTLRQPVRATPPKPIVATTSRPTTSAPTKPAPTPSTTVAPKRESPVMVQERKPVMLEKETVKEAVTTAVTTAATNVDVTPKTETTISPSLPTSSTPRPRRPSNKRKKNKNKNRRRRPAKKPAVTTQAPSSETELEVKESPQDDDAGNVASPLSTRIYNFIAREVMPSMSVGLLGLVVTAGLAGYFLLPTLGLQRRSDVASGGYSSGGSYGLGTGGQDDDGGIVQTIFQNVMASVSKGEKEFERGPRRRRNAITANEAENEIAATLKVKERDENWQQTNQAEITTTTSSPDATTSFSSENPTVLDSEIDPQKEISTILPESTDKMHTTTEGPKNNNNNSTHAMTPTSGWEGEYGDYPLTLGGILRRIAEFKLRIGVSLLRATTDVIARYLQDVQQRLRDSDKQDWLRHLESTVSRIRRSIDRPLTESREKDSIPNPRSRFSRQHRSKRHG